MEIVWQHKGIVARANNTKNAETLADLYSFKDVSRNLLEGLASIETLAEVSWEKVGAIRNLLQSSGSAEFFFLGLLGDFALRDRERLTGSEGRSSGGLPRQDEGPRKASLKEIEVGRESVQVDIGVTAPLANIGQL